MYDQKLQCECIMLKYREKLVIKARLTCVVTLRRLLGCRDAIDRIKSIKTVFYWIKRYCMNVAVAVLISINDMLAIYNGFTKNYYNCIVQILWWPVAIRIS